VCTPRAYATAGPDEGGRPSDEVRVADDLDQRRAVVGRGPGKRGRELATSVTLIPSAPQISA
jgi:hypothetical protein